MKSYFQLYKKAKELYDNNKIVLTDIKEEENNDTYYFDVNDYKVRLNIIRIPNTRQWTRIFSCDCKQFGLYQEKSECKHIKGAEYYLMNGGYK